MTTTKTRPRVTEETKAQRVADAHERLDAAVAAMTSGKDWEAWLQQAAVLAKFHRYSFNNVMLIMSQRPNATLVAGASRWKKMGRWPSKGERALWIYAPILVKYTDEEIAADPSLFGQEKFVGWTTVPVFDISQTSGRPLIEANLPVSILQGSAPEGAWDALVKIAKNNGFTMRKGEVRPAGANGVTIFDTNEIVVRDDLPGAQMIKTGVHELAHMFLHRDVPYAENRERCEVEAESVAFIVMEMLGVPSDDYSFGYVAGWAGDNKEVVKATGAIVMRTAGKVFDLIEKEMA